jgi:hypothetical protein
LFLLGWGRTFNEFSAGVKRSMTCEYFHRLSKFLLRYSRARLQSGAGFGRFISVSRTAEIVGCNIRRDWCRTIYRSTAVNENRFL